MYINPSPQTLPTKGIDNIDTKTKRLVVILCYSISFYNTLSRSNFDIEGIVAGITPAITLIEEVSLFIQISKQEFGPIWVRIIRLMKSHFISDI